MQPDADQSRHGASDTRLTLFLCGDVMLGRGIDQILPYPCDPALHESYVQSACGYVDLAERANGPITKPVDLSYVWGVAIEELTRRRPDARIVNLETSVTRSSDFAAKGINYRMSPENAACLKAAAIDCCALANNHVLDWGRAGLLETLSTLEQLGIKTAGAGRDNDAAAQPAVLDIAGKGRVLVFSFATVTSGAPRSWAATARTPGINVLADLSEASVAAVADHVRAARRAGDVIVVSVHWGPNWGYDIPTNQRRFARQLVEHAGVSIVHGHSSHHPKAIEVHCNRLILYGCGDFLNDYEGIEGYEEFRGDLVAMYFAEIDCASSDLAAFEIVPLQIKRLRLNHPSRDDVGWFARCLDQQCSRWDSHLRQTSDGRLALSWSSRSAE